MEKNTKDVTKIFGLSRPVFLIIVGLLCVLSLCFGIYAQYFYKYADSDALMFGIGRGQAQDEEEIRRLKNEFDSIFTNDISVKGDYKIKKEDETKEAVYTLKTTQKETDSYSVDINIPKLNINSDVAKEINTEIENIFVDKLNNITQGTSQKTIYNIYYKTYINGNLLSLIIKSTLKEGSNSQTVIIKTYNYNLETNKKASFEDVLDAKGLDKKAVQIDIDEELKYLNEKDEELKNTTNYDIKLRDLNDDIYKVENVDNFMVSTNGYLYVIYAYGNQELTSKHDIIIFK